MKRCCKIASRVAGAAMETLRRFQGDQRGAVAIFFAGSVMMLFGMATIAIDLSYLYTLSGKLQNTADAAVLAAVDDIADLDVARATALSYAVKNMSLAEHGSVLVASDVSTGNWDDDTRTFDSSGAPVNAIQVVTRRAEANGNAAGLFFARIMGIDSVDLQATAIARFQQEGDFCVIALDSGEKSALKIAGGAVVTLNCGVHVNSSSNKGAINVAGAGACLRASSISVVGSAKGNCINPEADTGADSMTDPLAGLPPPTDSGCDFATLLEVSADTVLSPGVYCGGISIYGGGIVDFEPGEYLLKGEGLSISGNGDVTGDGVMFYIDPSATGIGGSTKTVSIAGTVNINFSAPTSGVYEDILFYQDAAAPSGYTNKFNGNANTELNGILYFPSTEVQFAGNGDPGGATSIIGRMVTFTGNANLGGNSTTRLFGADGESGVSLVQ